MAPERIGDMTLDELKLLIDAAVERHWQELQKPKDVRSVKEINASIKRNRRTPRAGTPSTLELLREDRNR